MLWWCGEGCIIKNLARIGPDIVCYTCNLIANVADGDEYDMLWFQLQQLHFIGKGDGEYEVRNSDTELQ